MFSTEIYDTIQKKKKIAKKIFIDIDFWMMSFKIQFVLLHSFAKLIKINYEICNFKFTANKSSLVNFIILNVN